MNDLPLNMTACANTPENWKRFEALKARLNHHPLPKQRKEKPLPLSKRRPILIFGYNTVSR